MVTLLLLFLIAYIVLKLRDQKLYGIYLDYLLSDDDSDSEDIETNNLSPEMAESED